MPNNFASYRAGIRALRKGIEKIASNNDGLDEGPPQKNSAEGLLRHYFPRKVHNVQGLNCASII